MLILCACVNIEFEKDQGGKGSAKVVMVRFAKSKC